MKFLDNVGQPSSFPTSLPDCLCHASSRFFQRIFAIKSRNRRKKSKNVKVLWPQLFSGGTTPTFLRHVVSATYHPPFGCLAKFGRVPFADLRLRSLAMKWNAEFTEGG